jgi:hypothetical protein
MKKLSLSVLTLILVTAFTLPTTQAKTADLSQDQIWEQYNNLEPALDPDFNKAQVDVFTKGLLNIDGGKIEITKSKIELLMDRVDEAFSEIITADLSITPPGMEKMDMSVGMELRYVNQAMYMIFSEIAGPSELVAGSEEMVNEWFKIPETDEAVFNFDQDTALYTGDFDLDLFIEQMGSEVGLTADEIATLQGIGREIEANNYFIEATKYEVATNRDIYQFKFDKFKARDFIESLKNDPSLAVSAADKQAIDEFNSLMMKFNVSVYVRANPLTNKISSTLISLRVGQIDIMENLKLVMFIKPRANSTINIEEPTDFIDLTPMGAELLQGMREKILTKSAQILSFL